MKSTVKRIICVIMSFVLVASVGVCALAYSNDYVTNSRFHIIKGTQATQKKDNGDKFILFCYGETCGNSQYIGTNVLTKWMNDYKKDIYGIKMEAATDAPTWVFQAVTDKTTVTLPMVVFVQSGIATGYSCTDYTAQELEKVICNKFYSFYGIDAPTDITDTISAIGTTTLNFSVTYHQTEAREMLDMVNKFRTSDDAWYWNEDNVTKTYVSGLNELTYDYDLEKSAMQRAAEIAAYYSHMRPDGSKPFTTYSNYQYPGENIGYGYDTAQLVQTAWEEADVYYEKQGHRRAMLNAHYTAIGIACAEYQGIRFWVQEFRSPIDPTNAYTKPNDSKTKVKVAISNSNIVNNKVTYRVEPGQYQIAVGKWETAPTVTKIINTKSYKVMPFEEDISVTWISANPEIATVEDGKIVGKSKGTTTINTIIDGKTISIKVTVLGESEVTQPPKEEEVDVDPQATLSFWQQIIAFIMSLIAAIFG